MGVVWIVVVGWMVIGTVLGTIGSLLLPLNGGTLGAGLGAMAGIGIGIVLHANWLPARRKKS